MKGPMRDKVMNETQKYDRVKKGKSTNPSLSLII